MRDDFQIKLPCLRRRDEQLEKISGLKGRYFDCCSQGCMAYTGTHVNKIKCDFCDRPRYLHNPGELSL